MKKYNPLNTEHFLLNFDLNDRSLLQNYKNQVESFIFNHTGVNNKSYTTGNGTLLLLNSVNINLVQYEQLVNITHEVRHRFHFLSTEQNKSLNIGSRSLQLPLWSTKLGRVKAFDIYEHSPVKKIILSKTIAYRGGNLTAKDALLIINDRLNKSKESYANNIKNSLYNRPLISAERISKNQQALDYLNNAIIKYADKEVIVRLHSGNCSKLTFIDNDNQRWQDTPANILMVYCNKDVDVEIKNEKKRRTSQLIKIGSAAGISLFVHKK